MAGKKGTDHMDRYEPPAPWQRPVQEKQLSLFPFALDEYMAMLNVSRDDVRRWKALGWISFDVDALSDFHCPNAWELTFVRNLARSGLSDQQIDHFLGELRPPYSYNPLTTAYHFGHGWVQAPAPLDEVDVLKVVEEYMDAWIKLQAETGNVDSLHNLMSKCFNATYARQGQCENG
jgi:hypothetical protein